jgi:RNA 2',3'-cyclic 3'-phosphodiesterase
MRLFVALDIDESVKSKISRFIEGVRELAPEARWVKPESLHVTLKFIGEKPDHELEIIKTALGTIEAGAFEMNICGHGFFPNTRAPRVFWIGIAADSNLGSLAAKVDEKLGIIGVKQEEHDYHPHLTLARVGQGSGAPHRRKEDKPNRSFQRLQEKLSNQPVPDFGKVMAREFFLYKSQFSPQGSKYTKLAAFPLR